MKIKREAQIKKRNICGETTISAKQEKWDET